MLEFNENHKSINGSLKNSKKIKVRNIILAGLTVTSLFLFNGCAKTVKCDIPESHAHSYVSAESFDRYVVSEDEYIGVFDRWIRTSDYIIVDKEMEDLLQFVNSQGLFKISDNQVKIDGIVSLQSDYVEYRYKYTETKYITIGKRRQPIISTKYSWTRNSSREGLTGEERNVHHMYYGYKVVKDENGVYQMIRSPYVDSLSDLPEGYDYIGEEFCVKVNAYDKNVMLDYEDGPQYETDIQSIYEISNELDNDSRGR